MKRWIALAMTLLLTLGVYGTGALAEEPVVIENMGIETTYVADPENVPFS